MTTTPIPKSGVPGLVENWRFDILSGFLVFLIALPLCLGIAMASGCPPVAGIITAIVGGLIVSRINGSYVTINGPAAGLIVVILDSVHNLGHGDLLSGYHFTLAAIVIASVLQIIMGLCKAGKLSAYFPLSVVHGMLAAIGIIIMAKQIHTLLGVKPEAKSLIETILEVPNSIINLNPEITAIGVLGLVILIGWTFIKHQGLKMIPAPLLVVILGLTLSQYFDLDDEHHYLFNSQDFLLGPKYLVPVPEQFINGLSFPDFSQIGEGEFWLSVLTIWLVGSLESLLSASAVDKLDPYKRTSNLNKDLTAVGIGNLICGLVGGLPMIAEIVRSSANINNGARTAWSNFFHGLFLLIFVALFPHLIHEIPLAALAALLVFTGFRLASPKEFKHMWHVGKDSFLVFVATIVGVIATDLLIGVAIGMTIELIIQCIRGVKFNNLFKINLTVTNDSEERTTFKIKGSAIFTNYIGLKTELLTQESDKYLVIDVSETSLIDHTVTEFLDHFGNEYQQAGGTFEMLGFDTLKPYSNDNLSARHN